MLIIRKEQMATFCDYMLGQFVKRMVKLLKDDFPKELQAHNLQEDELEPMVQRGVAEAKEYGIEYEYDLELYIQCMVLLNPNFDKDDAFPWAKEILTNQDIDSELKMSAFSQYINFR